MPVKTTAIAAAVLLAATLPARAGEVYQVSTIAALLAGNYEGVEDLRPTLAHGDLGLGTFDGVDGELIIVDGVAWQARGDGSVARAARSARTPFAEVTRFRPERHVAVPAGLSLKQLEEMLDRQAPGWAGILAVRVDGRFTRLTVRSEPKQLPPFRPLAEVMKTDQKTWDHQGVDGTLVAFRFPPEANPVAVPGWHFHFLSADHRIGGHVLGLETAKARAGVERIADLRVRFPAAAAAAAPAAAGPLSEQMNTVERWRR